MNRSSNLKFLIVFLALIALLSGTIKLSKLEPAIDLKTIAKGSLELDGVKINDSKSQVTSRWGEPASIEDHPLREDGYKYWKYPDGSWILFSGDRAVRVCERNGPLLANGIELPSSGFEVSKLYAKLGELMEYEYGKPTTIDYITAGKELIQYSHIDGRVTKVSLGDYDK
jgi:hypothetical protein